LPRKRLLTRAAEAVPKFQPAEGKLANQELEPTAALAAAAAAGTATMVSAAPTQVDWPWLQEHVAAALARLQVVYKNQFAKLLHQLQPRRPYSERSKWSRGPPSPQELVSEELPERQLLL
jgi:hypothetical protein